MAFGCMYNVRDVGFTDIGVRIPYRLYYYVREDTPETLTSTFRQISYAVLMDSNIEVEIINVDQQREHPDRMVRDPAMKYLDFWELQSFPAAILVSPKGQSLILPVFSMLDSSIQYPASSIQYRELWSALESIVTSPKREEILSSIVEAYCVVLLIQGEDATENKKVRAAVVNAIAEISRLMSQMPKPIEEPPHLVVIPPELFSQERTLLWSLGVNRDQGSVNRDQGNPHSLLTDPYFPVVAVLYGRGRRIGPLLAGKRITATEVFSILSAIGSAEWCEVDEGSVLGTMFPLRWGEEIQSEAARSLGFDAESPMVKTEMSQILSMGLSSRIDGEGTVERAGTADVPLLEEYSEKTVALESGPDAATVSPAQFRELVSLKPAASEVGTVFRRVLFIVGGMVLLILAGGVFIILRARQKRKGIGISQ
jgi:hypothetical protein